MKTTSLKTGIIAAAFIFFIAGVELNALASPPSWAPAHGYKAKTRYIYFPQENIYYDLKTSNYIYPSGTSWIFGVNLPSIFGPVNLITARQIELDYYYSKPYVYNKKHVVIYNSPAKIKVVKMKSGNGNEYHQKGKQENGNAYGKNKGKGHKK